MKWKLGFRSGFQGFGFSGGEAASNSGTVGILKDPIIIHVFLGVWTAPNTVTTILWSLFVGGGSAQGSMVSGLGFRVRGFGVWGSGFSVCALALSVEGSRDERCTFRAGVFCVLDQGLRC